MCMHNRNSPCDMWMPNTVNALKLLAIVDKCLDDINFALYMNAHIIFFNKPLIYKGFMLWSQMT